MSNRLALESSPYLLQHKDNPVDWWPWRPDALAEAKKQDKPIFVSIGYSSCHWCHVMAHESFEDEAVASLMNEHFINVKVDREERPDVDSLYMMAVQAMTGHGGWPLNAFLTPELVPFYGGTYWPLEDREGLPSFPKVIEAVSSAFENQRDEVVENSENIRNFLMTATQGAPKRSPIDQNLPERSFNSIAAAFDDKHGGFGGAPKFPQPGVLEFLLGYAHYSGNRDAEKILRLTLDKMASGGMYDQVGGGFHRYSVDAEWIVPHFEKMLYDNAQLARLYTDAYRSLGDRRYAEVAGDVLDYVLESMTSPEGAFLATEDADTEGEEGKYYVWSESEFDAVVPEGDREFAGEAFGISPDGNFEGKSIPVRSLSLEELAARHSMSDSDARSRLDEIRSSLADSRQTRVQPGKDEKIIASWNGMMIRAMAEGGRALDRADAVQAAEKCAAFLEKNMWDGQVLKHSFKDGKATVDGYLDDYANFADGLIALYESTGNVMYMELAIDIAHSMIEQFADANSGLLFDSAEGHEPLVSRARDVHDGATPSGNAVAADVLLRLARYTGQRSLEERGTSILEHLSRAMAEQPQGFGRALHSVQRYLATPKEVAIAVSEADGEPGAFLTAYFSIYEPSAIIGVTGANSNLPENLLPFLMYRTLQDGKTAAYVCEHHSCMTPVTDPAEMVDQLTAGSGVVWAEF